VVSIVGSFEVKTVDDVRSAVRSCVENGHGLMPLGGGVRSYIGHEAIKPLYSLTTNALNNVVEYEPEDLVVCAEAGMTLSALQATLRASGQWLPVDVAYPEKQTLGGIVASRPSSALRPGCGSIRDWLIGLDVVNCKSEIVKCGGKVVKNVSGYDLPKLYCGSFGSLGVITQTNFKVSPLPEADRSLLVVLSENRNAEELLDAILLSLNPAAALLFNSNAAGSILGESCLSAQYLYLRFLGLAEDVSSSIESAAALLAPFASTITALPDVLAQQLYRLLADFGGEEAILSATYHILSSQVGAYVRMLDWIAARHNLNASVVADVSCGIVHANYHGSNDTDWLSFLALFNDKAKRVGGSLIVERMPDSWRRAGVPVWSPILPEVEIMKLIKKQLDPENVFNPGRFIGGI
jgi:glycolate oxidase FAD binding subunit